MEELFILPFDHRASFSRDLLGVRGKPTIRQKKQVIELKRIIFDAFLRAQKKAPRGLRANLGILIDEEYGSTIISQARKKRIPILLTTEKSGKPYFDFEYNDKFERHLKKIRPTFAKALVRFNPDNRDDNDRSLRNLKRLADACRVLRIKLLIEPLVPATDAQLKRLRGSHSRYDRKLRPKLTARALGQMQVHGIRPHVWKLEGMWSSGDWKRVLKVTGETPVVVLGRNAPMSDVMEWLKIASRFDQIIGFAVGRTLFQKPLQRFMDKSYTREEAVHKIAAEFLELIRYWGALRR